MSPDPAPAPDEIGLGWWDATTWAAGADPELEPLGAAEREPEAGG